MEEIVEVNQSLVKLEGQPHAVVHPATLDYLVSTVQYRYNDKPFDEAVILKAAFLVDTIANKGHVFGDGNKRTAMAVLIAFLGINVKSLHTKSPLEIPEFILEVAKGNVSLNKIARWIKERIKTDS
ncbi:MAG TPA: type II toxin-antitoxin system death-on-curing family toxin [Candidatus Norongarragalinales archaeon]|nr:type II toxin-antitoxin system death-on-curing family toxin [Candidatus Norongarragalinales archaeon]